MNYRRAFIQNSYLHIVIVSYERKPIFVSNIVILRNAFINAKRYYNFEITAICILPEHIHLLIKPQNIFEYPKIISSIKYYFSKNVGQECPTYNLKSGYKNKREKGIFQHRYFEHTILDENDFEKQLNYIHYNPVKHNLVQNVKDWEYSSFRKFVKQGVYEENWGTSFDVEKIKDLNFE